MANPFVGIKGRGLVCLTDLHCPKLLVFLASVIISFLVSYIYVSSLLYSTCLYPPSTLLYLSPLLFYLHIKQYELWHAKGNAIVIKNDNFKSTKPLNFCFQAEWRKMGTRKLCQMPNERNRNGRTGL